VEAHVVVAQIGDRGDLVRQLSSDVSLDGLAGGGEPPEARSTSERTLASAENGQLKSP
jgi:hypothetical protein